MTTLTADLTARPVARTHAPLGRLLRSELRLVLRRPRTLIALGLLVLVPVVTGIGIALAANGTLQGPPGADGPGAIAAILNENGLVLPIFVLFVSLQMLLPMMGAMWAADALAGEAASGSLRNLLVAPVGRVRLLAVKAFGVASAVLTGVALLTVSGVLCGLLLLGGDSMITISGTTLSFWPALGRILLMAALVTVQVLAVAAVALAISSITEHPLIVMAVALGGIIVFTVLNAIPALDWLHPLLITDSWSALVDVMRDPMPTDGLVEGVLRALCYMAIGGSLALARMLTKDG
ncbi:MAG TPA: ABC transporter permease subunit [Actinophytocola sp.]|uniref:ABC transporter permease subunit n=1 Tax=Actinophytocola sp. TaxID=1872138 RepID=UPI002DBCFC98|nr:ABC transporter permease subunit [Actinophytocola sp.]HEU5472084.1 ABC transporter permease subunit [Actinophytocola sp.]